MTTKSLDPFGRQDWDRGGKSRARDSVNRKWSNLLRAHKNTSQRKFLAGRVLSVRWIRGVACAFFALRRGIPERLWATRIQALNLWPPSGARTCCVRTSKQLQADSNLAVDRARYTKRLETREGQIKWYKQASNQRSSDKTTWERG